MLAVRAKLGIKIIILKEKNGTQGIVEACEGR